jgi:hypothetical protein
MHSLHAPFHIDFEEMDVEELTGGLFGAHNGGSVFLCFRLLRAGHLSKCWLDKDRLDFWYKPRAGSTTEDHVNVRCFCLSRIMLATSPTMASGEVGHYVVYISQRRRGWGYKPCRLAPFGSFREPCHAGYHEPWLRILEADIVGCVW